MAAIPSPASTVLRVLLPAGWSAGTAAAWSLVDASGAVRASGRGTPGDWPASARREAILAPGAARVVGLALPPVPPARLASAVRYALEDRFASGGDTLQVASTPQRDGRVRAVAVDRAWLAAIAPRFDAIVALPTRVGVDRDWHWYDSASPDERFVVLPDGSALAAARPDASDVQLALRNARAAGEAPARIVAHNADAAAVATWSGTLGLPFATGAPWRWDAAPPANVPAPPDLRSTAAGDAAPASADAWRAALKPATRVALAAVVVYALGLASAWGWERFDAWRHERAVVTLARDAGIADADTAATALPALATRYRDALHRAGKPAPDDALPLLAAASPALATLPRGALRRATYAGGAWTFETAPLPAAARTTLDRAFADAGLTAIAATATEGMRVRVTR